jgi:hypothetical protein
MFFTLVVARRQATITRGAALLYTDGFKLSHFAA